MVRAAAEEASTASTKQRIQIFRERLLPAVRNKELSADDTGALVDIIFKTLNLYDDRPSRNAVDDLIGELVGEITYMKNFAAVLVQSMERQSKTLNPPGSYRLLKWSCLLLKRSQFASLSKNAFLKLATAQASLLPSVLNGSFRMHRSCRKLFRNLFSEFPDIYKLYIEELKESRISARECSALIWVLLTISTAVSASVACDKPVFLDLYIKTVLNAKEKPSNTLSQSFEPLLSCLGHEDLKNSVVPSSLKMLKRNPEIVLESIGYLLKSVNLDLSKYVAEFLPVVIPQLRHADERRRAESLTILGYLSERSSDPDAPFLIFNSLKSVIGGSEGKLAYAYQRVGMINAIQELSKAPSGKLLNNMAPSVAALLISCYRDDGSEEVKLAVLSALAYWSTKSADSVNSEVISFIATGLKEKEALRRGHLRCLLGICKNADGLTKVLPLLDPLIQLVKSGFTKATQRLDGIYSLFIVLKITSVHAREEDVLAREKIWSLLSQNEPSVVSMSLAFKIPVDDCLACIDLIEVLLLEHINRVLEELSIKPLIQLMLYLICHPNWEIRKAAQSATQKISLASSILAEKLLTEFSCWLTLLHEKELLAKRSDSENFGESQLPFVPSVELLVKGLFLLAVPALAVGSAETCTKLIFCAHHPCLSLSGHQNSVWKRLVRCLMGQKLDIIDVIAKNIRSVCRALLGSDGLRSSNYLEQHAAIGSLSTLMGIMPNETFSEFEEVLGELPERAKHDELSENDIKIFHTPEGVLSTEHGVYVAEAVAAKNTRLARGRFKAYTDQDEFEDAKPAVSVSREPNKRETTNTVKKDGKANKKTANVDKGKTAKEEARELLLREESSVRDRVRNVQSNLSMMLVALGEMALGNPVFTHLRLPSLVTFVNPLLKSPIVGDAAFVAMLKLARCLGPPLCDWAPEIAAGLRLISTEDKGTLWDSASDAAGAEIRHTPYMSVFEKAAAGLSISCKNGPLPADSFTFIFPILEKILYSSKKTSLHDTALQIISLHLDPILPLPRLKMLKVLYHVLGVVPAYQVSIAPMLNELCLGLQPSEVAQALCGIFAKDVHVRLSCLSAIKCVPALSNRSIPEDVEVASSIWLALHDPVKAVAEAAEDVWDLYGFEFGTDYSVLFSALSHLNYNVRVSAAEALAAAMDENPGTIQETLSTLFALYVRDLGLGLAVADPCWIGRQGIALALNSGADVVRAKDLPIVMTFLISRALADPNNDVRGRMINAGILIINKHGKENVSLLFPIFENYLNKKASDEEKYDLVREGVVIYTGALAKHLSKDDPKVHSVIEKLLDVINTPSEAVQRAVSDCLSPLMGSKQEEGQTLVSDLLKRLMKSEKYGERRGAAFGLAGIVKGFGISSIKNYGVVTALLEALEDRNSAKSREGALLGFECLCEKLGRLFEPYVIQILPFLLVSFSDQVAAVREAAECAARAMMSQLSGYGVKLILPSLLKGLEDKAWRTKQSSVQLLGAMAYCAPQQLSQCLPKIVPKLTEVLTDTHPKVQSAGQTALQQVGSVIKNPEISALVPTLLMGLQDPNEYAKHSLDILLQTTFINSVDAPSLALVVPIVHRGLRERSAETKKKAAQIAGNMCSLVTEPTDMIPYIGLLLPEIKKVLVDPIPEVRSVAARALGSLIRGMGEENFPDLVQWLLDTLKSDSSNVERSGAAQGLSEVLAALGTGYFETILPDIIRNCGHQKASVRDGHLTLFKYLPRSLGTMFQSYLQQVLPAILDGLADENESVRDAALSAGHVFVEHYATTSLPLLLPAVEDGIFNDNWRIRQSSVELLGDLLFKVAGTSGKAILEGGSDDEGSSTEAHGRAIIEVLGRNKRDEVLSAVYMVRTDVSLSVRQAALHVWKTVVANTPKTLKEIMPVLMDTLISSLAAASSERRQVAARALGELVRKLGERFLPSIIPSLSKGLKDSDTCIRQGVCIGLSEVMASAGKHQLMTYMDELIPTIRTALCDSTPEVREYAAAAFSTLYKSAGMQAIDEIVPTLLHALEDDDTSDTALDGLKQILSVRASAVLPHILPKLVQLPFSAFSAHALGALAEVAGPGLNPHLGMILPPLLMAMGDDDEDVQLSARKSAETVVMVIDEEGISALISELQRAVCDNEVLMRRGSAYLIGYFFKNSKLYLVDEAPGMIYTLILLLGDSDSSIISAAWEALGRVIASIPKDLLSMHIKLVRDAISTARDKERRKKKGAPVLIPGLCLPKALQPLLPIFLQGLISGSAETREQAAEGLGELIEVTSEKTLKEFVVPITGPLIRIIGDRFPWQVKAAILSTLDTIICKGGIALKPFLPQLQTTFVKCLQDNTRMVRSSSAHALGKLSSLSTRVDPLVGDLIAALQASDGGVKEAVLTALKGVLKHAGKNISSVTRNRLLILLKDFVQHESDELRGLAARVVGVTSQYLDNLELVDLLDGMCKLSLSSTWFNRHGSLLTFASVSFNNPSMMCQSSVFPSVVDRLKVSLADDKFPIREAATKTSGRLLVHLTQTESKTAPKELLNVLISSLQDDSSEVRRRSLSSLKAVAKVNTEFVLANISSIGPAVAELLKDGNTPVRLAAERCVLHVFQLTKGPEKVQAAQKYLTGLEARRLSKLSEDSDASDASENDADNS